LYGTSRLMRSQETAKLLQLHICLFEIAMIGNEDRGDWT
jgi:hypothetical protein